MTNKVIGLACATLNNYGSLLQTYALQTVIGREKIGSEIINYHEPILRKLMRMGDFEYLQTIFKKVFLDNPILGNGKVFPKNLTDRAACFDKFRKANLHFSVVCNNRTELTKLALSYKMVLLGSDQLWHPMNLLMDFYTLTFVPKGILKASYAASFGTSEIPEKMKKKYNYFISKFDYLSCREEAGVKLVKQLTGRTAQVVCDPTLLMTAKEWEPLLMDILRIEGNFIFCYFLGTNENHRILAKEWSERTGLKIVALPHIVEYVECDENYADYTPYKIGPAEFISLINKATFVFTDSFHASVFSLLFHKQLFVFDRFENNNVRATTSRIETLLGIVGQGQRLVKHNAQIENLCELEDIDFSQTDERLASFREQSYKYLRDVLNAI